MSVLFSYFSSDRVWITEFYYEDSVFANTTAWIFYELNSGKHGDRKYVDRTNRNRMGHNEIEQ